MNGEGNREALESFKLLVPGAVFVQIPTVTVDHKLDFRNDFAELAYVFCRIAAEQNKFRSGNMHSFFLSHIKRFANGLRINPEPMSVLIICFSRISRCIPSSA